MTTSTPNRIYPRIFFFTLAWIFFMYGVGVLADRFFSNTSMTFTGAGLFSGWKGSASQFLRWDGVHYFRIAFYGYLPIFPGLKAFFPLYPILLNAGSVCFRPLTQDGFYLYLYAYYLINLVSLFGAMFLIQKLHEKHAAGEDRQWPASLFMLMLPCAFFYLSPYPEALTLCLSAGAFLAAIKGRWISAGLLAGLASASRLQGAFLAPALAVEYACQKKWNWKNIRVNVLGLLLCPAGAIAYFWYLGGPDVFLKAQQRWLVRREPWNPIMAFKSYYQNGFQGIRADGQKIGMDEQLSYHFSMFTLCLCVFLLAYAWKRLRPSYRTYIILCLAVPILSSSVMALQRYNLVMFPLSFAAADFFKNKPTAMAMTAFIFGVFSCLFVALFVNGFFVS